MILLRERVGDATEKSRKVEQNAMAEENVGVSSVMGCVPVGRHHCDGGRGRSVRARWGSETRGPGEKGALHRPSHNVEEGRAARLWNWQQVVFISLDVQERFILLLIPICVAFLCRTVLGWSRHLTRLTSLLSSTSPHSSAAALRRGSAERVC